MPVVSISVCEKKTEEMNGIMFSNQCLIEELSAEQKEMQQLARKFTKEEIIPNAPHYDKTGEVKTDEIDGQNE